MKTLHIIASPRWAMSKSRMLWEFLTSKIGWEIIELDINSLNLPYISFPVIANNYGFQKYEDLSENDQKIVDLQTKLIAQIKSVDNVVVSVPLWNFGMPAVLKSYIDLISKVGETFSMGPNGYVGLINNVKNLYIVSSKGWTYAGTDWQDIEVLEKHTKQAFAFMGITNAKTFSIEWANMKDEATLASDIEKIKEEMVKNI